jgi:hypothetical protein
MDVFRHDDVSPQGKAAALPSGVQCLDEPLAGPVTVKQREPPEARESEFIGMTRLIEDAVLLSVRQGHGRQSQFCMAGMLSRLDIFWMTG